MKKYNAPYIRVVTIENNAILANSLGFSDTPVDGSEALSRRRRNSRVYEEEDDWD